MAKRKEVSERKARNDENIQQVTKVLFDAGYHCGNSMQGQNGHVEFFIGPGVVPVILLQYYRDDMGFELWKPIVASDRMDETLDALRTCVQRRPPSQ